jgi:hypothetical protein
MNSGKSELKRNRMLIVFAEKNSPRLSYIIQTLFDSVGLSEWRICFDQGEYISSTGDAFINYSLRRMRIDEMHIVPHSILFEDQVRNISISYNEWNNLKIFFESDGDIPFDIFAAAFYLISRYEEYLPFQADKFNRFPHTYSLAYREKFIDLPLVNMWMKQFLKLMKVKFPDLKYSLPNFQFIPTYDIDIAYRFKRSKLVNIGAFCKAVINFNLSDVRLQANYWLTRTKDCYDVFDWLLKMHFDVKVQAIFFFLVAEKRSRIDKNVQLIQMQQLIKNCEMQNEIGLHPSSQSSKQEILSEEKIALETVTKHSITKSRQHYILLRFPKTYQQLIAAGIKEDYSMGYSTVNGFRASFAHSFNWFDLSSNTCTDLKIYPFCFMDAASFSNKKQNVDEAYKELYKLYNKVKEVNGCFIPVIHNTLLTEEKRIKPWRTAYENFIRNITA